MKKKNSLSFSIEKPKDTWRIIVGIFILVLILAVSIGWYTARDNDQQELVTNSDTLNGKSFLDSVKNAQSQNLEHIIGGDITVEPPIPQQTPQLVGTLPPQEQFTAKAMIVKDNKTGAVLYKKNEYTKRPIASISKLMSALVILEGYVDWEQKATVVPDDLIDSHMYAGDVYTIDELWRAALVASSNKAILTLADSIGWPREAFVERMNQKAMELGMIDTHFEEPTGLNNQNVSTASDLVLLLDEALKLEKIQNTVLMDEVTLYSEQRDTSATLRNTDWLLLNWIPHHLYNIRGGKTGFINASGYNFIMQVEDEKGHIIDVVILGTNVHEARFIEARDIAQAVFDNYEWESEDATK